MRGREEVQPDAAPLVLDTVENLTRVDVGRIGAQDGIGRNHLCQLPEHRALDFKILEHRLDRQIGTRRIGVIRRGREPGFLLCRLRLTQLAALHGAVDQTGNAVLGSCCRLGVALDQHHLKTAAKARRGDARPHQPAADNRDTLQLTGRCARRRLGPGHLAFGKKRMAQGAALGALAHLQVQGAFLGLALGKGQIGPLQSIDVQERRHLPARAFHHRRPLDLQCVRRQRLDHALGHLFGPLRQIRDKGPCRGLQIPLEHKVQTAQRLERLRIQHLPRGRHVDGGFHPDQARRALRAARTGDQAHVDLGQAKAGARLRNPPGTGHRDLEPAPQHGAMQDRHKGRLAILDHLHNVGQMRLDRRRVELRHVTARDKGPARPGQDRDARALNLFHGLGQSGPNCRAGGIDGRIVDGHPGKVAFAADGNGAVGCHGQGSSPRRWRGRLARGITQTCGRLKDFRQHTA